VKELEALLVPRSEIREYLIFVLFVLECFVQTNCLQFNAKILCNSESWMGSTHMKENLNIIVKNIPDWALMQKKEL
jgi:hypothetical protein